jgi:hypothetical protein
VAAHVLFGLRTGGAAAAAEAIAARFGGAFQERESHYQGEYWLGRIGSATVKVVAQPDIYGDPVEPTFAGYATLIYVDGEPPIAELAGLRVGDEVIEQLRER